MFPVFMENDKNLVDRYLGGDVEALELLVERYRKQLFGFIINMLSGSADAEEVFQETWLRAIKAIHNYKHDRFLSWLFRIAHNLIVDKWRRNRDTVSLDAENDAGISPGHAVSHPGAGPDALVEMGEAGRIVLQVVDRLPREQKEVFLLRAQSDVSFKEIARIQGVSINTALARMSYAVARLRKELKNEM